MKLTGEKVLKRFEKAKQARSQWEDLWQDIYDYVLPAREGFYYNTPGEERMDAIFDETALVALDEFVSKMEKGLTPSFKRWFRLEPGTNMSVRQARRFQGQLDEVSNFIWKSIVTTNFATEAQELLTDLAIGWGCQTIEPGTDGRVISFKTIPQCQAYIDLGPFKHVDGVMRVRTGVPIRDIQTIWPKAVLSDSLRSKLAGDEKAATDLIECSYRDWEEVRTPTYYYQILATEDKSLVIDELHTGLGSRPFVTPRWSVASGEAYGRGPLVKALPAIRTVNLVQQMTLENGQMAISGIWQVDNDGVINADNIEIVPGAVYARDPGSKGLERTEWNGDFNVANLIIANMQENIRRALFAENLGSLERTPRSATEIATRTQNLAEQVGSSYGRLMTEWVIPMLQRSVYLLTEAGQLEMPRIDGKELQVVSTSPLAQAQRFEEIERLRGFGADLLSLTGQAGQLLLDQNVMAEELQMNWEVSPRLVRSAEAAAQLMQQTADMAGQMQGGMGGPQPPMQ